jgi:transposase/very-short-patch-repair endonuclease
MATKLNLSKETIDEICKLYTERVRIFEIGKRFGIIPKTIEFYLKKRGMFVKGQHKVSEEQKQEIIKDYYNNVPLEQIAKKFDTTVWTICDRMKRWGLRLNGPERRIFINRLGIPEEDVIAKHLEFKKDINETAKFYKVTRETVRKILKKHNIKSPNDDLIEYINSKKDYIIDKHKNGYSMAEVRVELGIGQTTMYNFCHRWGLELKYPIITSIERKIGELLTELGFKYERQFEVRRKRFDFYLFDLGLFIETNGNYWHGNPKLHKTLDLTQLDAQLRDIRKIRLAAKLKKKLIFIWEDEINNKWDQVKSIITNLSNRIPTQKNQFDFITEQTI